MSHAYVLLITFLHFLFRFIQSGKLEPSATLMKKITGESHYFPNAKPLKHGRDNEPVAKQEYMKYMSTCHKELQMSDCGLRVPPGKDIENPDWAVYWG